jgi:predicted MPP superfamily phosphohydrolase
VTAKGNRFLRLLLAIGIIVSGLLAYGTIVEPRFLIVNHITVPVIYVPGNHEHWRFDDEGGITPFLDQLQQAGCTVLVNQVVRVARQGGKGTLVLVGLDDSYSGHMDTTAAFATLGQGERAIVLEHCPIDAPDIVSTGHVSLILTGHTHGGQVRLPVFGDRLTAALAGSPLVSGMYSVAGVPVYVNRGLGMSVLPLRLFCLPEVTAFTLVSEPDSEPQ